MDWSYTYLMKYWKSFPVSILKDACIQQFMFFFFKWDFNNLFFTILSYVHCWRGTALTVEKVGWILSTYCTNIHAAKIKVFEFWGTWRGPLTGQTIYYRGSSCNLDNNWTWQTQQDRGILGATLLSDIWMCNCDCKIDLSEECKLLLIQPMED